MTKSLQAKISTLGSIFIKYELKIDRIKKILYAYLLIIGEAFGIENDEIFEVLLRCYQACL